MTRGKAVELESEEGVSLSWRLLQRGVWRRAAVRLPYSEGRRLALRLLHEFAGRRSYSLGDIELGRGCRQFKYEGSEMTLTLTQLGASTRGGG